MRFGNQHHVDVKESRTVQTSGNVTTYTTTKVITEEEEQVTMKTRVIY